MGDHERGVVGRQLGQRGGDRLFGMAVERGGGFVEDEDRRILENGAGDGDTLFLAAGELEPAFAHERVHAVGQACDQAIQMGHAGGAGDRVGRGVGLAVGDIVFDGVVEQHGVLGHHANGVAQAGQAELADIVPVDGDSPGIDVVEAKQQARERRLAGAGLADHGELFARRDGEVDTAQDLTFGVIAELHGLEADLGAFGGQRPRVGGVGDRGFDIEQAEHAGRIGHRFLELAIDEAEEVQWHEQLDHVGVDHHQVADRHLAGDHPCAGEHHHRGDGDGDHRGLDGVERTQ